MWLIMYNDIGANVLEALAILGGGKRNEKRVKRKNHVKGKKENVEKQKEEKRENLGKSGVKNIYI